MRDFGANSRLFVVSFFNHRHPPTKAVRELKQQRAAQFRSVAEIAPKSPFLCVNRIEIPIISGIMVFRASAKAIQYGVNTA